MVKIRKFAATPAATARIAVPEPPSSAAPPPPAAASAPPEAARRPAAGKTVPAARRYRCTVACRWDDVPYRAGEIVSVAGTKAIPAEYFMEIP